MKNIIKKLLRESLLKESYGPFKDSTMIPDYENLKNGNYDKLSSEYDNMEAEVVYMSPKEYLEYCAKIQDTSYEEQLNIVSGPYGSSKVDKLIELINSGVKLNMPYINTVKGYISQEGRHRAKAAMDLGYDKIPVLVIKPEGKENTQNLSSKIGVWDDLIKQNYGYLVRFDLNNIEEQTLLLNCVSKDNYLYLLDRILSSYLYPILYKEGLISIVKKESKEFHTMHKLDRSNVFEFIHELPDEYRKLIPIYAYNLSDEEDEKRDNDIKELVGPLRDLTLLFILEHNKDELSQIFTYDSRDKSGYLFIDEDIHFDGEYSSGKDMLLDMQLYDYLDFYKYNNNDIFKMDSEFIEKYKELLPETLGGVKVR